MEIAHIVAAVRGGDATGPGDCIPLCRKHNNGRRENQLHVPMQWIEWMDAVKPQTR